MMKEEDEGRSNKSHQAAFPGRKQEMTAPHSFTSPLWLEAGVR